MSMDNAENLFASSTSLNITQTWQTIEDTLSLNNTHDYYTFTISSPSNFNLALNDLSANADVLLFDDSGLEIAASSAEGIKNENINKYLGIGKYHIQVHQVDDAITSYNLKVKNNYIPQEFEFDIELIDSGIKLADTRIFDADGIDNIRKVDFWLKKQGGNWKKLATVSEFNSNSDGSIGFDYEISNLEEGRYYIWGRATDKSGARSNGWRQAIDVPHIVNPELENVPPTKLDFIIEQINGGIELKNAKVFDANGVDDLARVDFQLKAEDGEWIDIEHALDFSDDGDGSFGFKYSINSLVQGNYELKATAYDKAGASGDTLTTLFSVKNVNPSDFKFDIEAIEDGVTVTNTNVFDANGIDDLTKVDFWLKKDDQSWQNIDDAVEFRKSTDGSFSFDYSVNSLEAGDYVIWARSRDKSGSYSNSWENSFQIVNPTLIPQPEKDWFEQNIQDQSIRKLTKSLFSDNNLDRNDMIAILKATEDNNIADKIKDFRTIISNASYLGMQDYVGVLANKVVNDATNKSNNSNAEITNEELEKLINKWFKGSDRPQTSHTYQYAQGSLFQNGISHDDIRQGYINNCFFLAGLGATAVQSPEVIQNMFVDNGDGTFTVRFYNNGVADYLTVDRYLPTNNIGNFVYANAGDYHENARNELWVALAEKAYAQLNESGWINQDNTNSYNGIGNAGYLSDAFKHITGEKSVLGRFLNFNKVVDAFNSGEVIGFGSKSSGIESNIVASHAYALVEYNASTQKFTLLNPWSTNNSASKFRTLELSWSEIESNFSYWDSTISNVVST